MSGRDRWERIEEAFGRARGRSGAERSAILDEVCGGDAELRTEVESLLAADEDSESFLAQSVLEVDAIVDSAGTTGMRAGAYRLERRIGRGGMGEVWLAHRDDDAYRAEVAVKVIRRGLDTDDILARFRTERQVLASLKHANIAGLLDGGALPDGRPYLVMEHVDGRPIDEHCTRFDLGVPARLRLFLEVCGAVQHAHRALVVHRDLKPSNILVTDDGTPKLLDFGIAQMLEGSGSDARATVMHERRYSPHYASPELARGDATSTATDVYALGAILYQILTGALPYDLTAVSPVDYAQAIGATQPVPPSAAVVRDTTRHAAPRLARVLRGDLDRIVLHALRKEPDRRYPSVEQLADDVVRYLDGRPIRARPDRVGYRVGKFVRRNRIGVAVAAAMAIALVAATVVSTTFAIQATRQARIATAVVDFMRDDLLGRADPHEEPDPDITLRAVLDRASATIGGRFEDEPLVHAALRSTLGVAYAGLGEPAEAIRHHEAAVAMRDAELGRTHPDTLAARSGLNGALIDAGDFARAAELVPAVLEDARGRHGPHHALTLAGLKHQALVHDGLGDYDAALAAMREAVDAHAAALGARDPATLTARNDLALMLVDAGRYDEAEPMVRAVLAARLDVLGATHPDTLLSRGSLGYLLSDLGRDAEAEDVLRRTVDVARAALGPEHPRTAAYMSLRATALRGLGRAAEAEAVAAEALRVQRARLGAAHPEALISLTTRGSLLKDLGRHDEALPLMRERHALGVEAQGREHPSTLIAQNNLANLLLEMDRDAEAERVAAEAVALGLEHLPEGYWLIGAFQTNHGRALIALERYEEARRTLDAARTVLVGALGEDHARVERVDALRAEIP